MATNISNSLNEMWDPAWNVVVGYLTDLLIDSVFCGYAFRFHWFWHNNYKGYSIAIVKDYNCHTWATYDSNSPASTSNSTWGQSVASDIDGRKGRWAAGLAEFPPNIWLAVCQVVSWAESSETLVNTYSAFGFEGQPGGTVSVWGGRICHAEGGEWAKITTTAGNTVALSRGRS